MNNSIIESNDSPNRELDNANFGVNKIFSNNRNGRRNENITAVVKQNLFTKFR